jgi:hypothetical protein
MHLLTRKTIPPLEVQPTSTGWRTPEAYVNLRPLGLPAADAVDALRALLVPELALKLGVPERCVSLRTQQSWVDPRGRLVFWLEATRPVLDTGAAAAEGVVDV